MWHAVLLLFISFSLATSLVLQHIGVPIKSLHHPSDPSLIVLTDLNVLARISYEDQVLPLSHHPHQRPQSAFTWRSMAPQMIETPLDVVMMNDYIYTMTKSNRPHQLIDEQPLSSSSLSANNNNIINNNVTNNNVTNNNAHNKNTINNKNNNNTSGKNFFILRQYDFLHGNLLSQTSFRLPCEPIIIDTNSLTSTNNNNDPILSLGLFFDHQCTLNSVQLTYPLSSSGMIEYPHISKTTSHQANNVPDTPLATHTCHIHSQNDHKHRFLLINLPSSTVPRSLQIILPPNSIGYLTKPIHNITLPQPPTPEIRRCLVTQLASNNSLILTLVDIHHHLNILKSTQPLIESNRDPVHLNTHFQLLHQSYEAFPRAITLVIIPLPSHPILHNNAHKDLEPSPPRKQVSSGDPNNNTLTIILAPQLSPCGRVSNADPQLTLFTYLSSTMTLLSVHSLPPSIVTPELQSSDYTMSLIEQTLVEQEPDDEGLLNISRETFPHICVHSHHIINKNNNLHAPNDYFHCIPTIYLLTTNPFELIIQSKEFNPLSTSNTQEAPLLSPEQFALLVAKFNTRISSTFVIQSTLYPTSSQSPISFDSISSNLTFTDSKSNLLTHFRAMDLGSFNPFITFPLPPGSTLHTTVPLEIHKIGDNQGSNRILTNYGSFSTTTVANGIIITQLVLIPTSSISTFTSTTTTTTTHHTPFLSFTSTSHIPQYLQALANFHQITKGHNENMIIIQPHDLYSIPTHLDPSFTPPLLPTQPHPLSKSLIIDRHHVLPYLSTLFWTEKTQLHTVTRIYSFLRSLIKTNCPSCSPPLVPPSIDQHAITSLLEILRSPHSLPHFKAHKAILPQSAIALFCKGFDSPVLQIISLVPSTDDNTLGSNFPIILSLNIISLFPSVFQQPQSHQSQTKPILSPHHMTADNVSVHYTKNRITLIYSPLSQPYHHQQQPATYIFTIDLYRLSQTPIIIPITSAVYSYSSLVGCRSTMGKYGIASTSLICYHPAQQSLIHFPESLLTPPVHSEESSRIQHGDFINVENAPTPLLHLIDEQFFQQSTLSKFERFDRIILHRPKSISHPHHLIHFTPSHLTQYESSITLCTLHTLDFFCTTILHDANNSFDQIQSDQFSYLLLLTTILLVLLTMLYSHHRARSSSLRIQWR